MKNFKRGRHPKYHKIHEQTHRGQSVSGFNERRKATTDLIEIIGDSKTIPQVDPGILNIIDKGKLNYWLSKFVVEVRKKKDPGNI